MRKDDKASKIVDEVAMACALYIILEGLWMLLELLLDGGVQPSHADGVIGALLVAVIMWRRGRGRAYTIEGTMEVVCCGDCFLLGTDWTCQNPSSTMNHVKMNEGSACSCGRRKTKRG